MGMTVDLNCDLGEGAGRDAELMPEITSANIACGAHAGDEATMKATVALARAHGVALGAHPGFADRAHFGRRELALGAGEAGALVAGQVEVLRRIAAEQKAKIAHVKLHGALYNLAARDPAVAVEVVEALWSGAWRPLLMVLAGSAMERVARERDAARVVAEVFADRTYQRDGSLTPRSQPGALIDDEEQAVAQVLRMVREGVVRSLDGIDVPIRAETICVHGDGPRAVGFARRLRAELLRAGVALKAFPA
jgi:UPF0271 protein